LTEEEKKAKLAELRERLAAKRAAQASVDLAETKKNEAIRRKKTQETEQLKEDLRRREQLKEVEKRKQEQREDARAKERVRQKIKEQQEAKRLQAEAEKAAREGKPQPTQPEAAAAPPPPKVSASHSESRLQLRLPRGQQPLIKTFSAETTLFEVASAVENERGMFVYAPRAGMGWLILLDRLRSYFFHHDLPAQGLQAGHRFRTYPQGGGHGSLVCFDRGLNSAWLWKLQKMGHLDAGFTCTLHNEWEINAGVLRILSCFAVLLKE
jgi:hypothetical protein